MSNLHRTQIYLEDAQIAALDARANALGVSRSDLIREMVDRGLAADDRQPNLYEAVMRFAGPRAPAGGSAGRAALEAELETRAAALRRRRAGKSD